MAALFSSSMRTALAAVGGGATTGAALRRSPIVVSLFSCPAKASALGAMRCYSEEVHDHFRQPRNVGALSSEDPAVGTAVVGKAACGDVIKLQVKVQDGVICDAKFKTFGCGSAIASSSYATELIKGKTTEAALGVTNKQISGHLNLPPVKLHCSLLAEDAVRLAIRNFEEKQKQSGAAAASTDGAAAEGGGSSGGDGSKKAAEEAIVL